MDNFKPYLLAGLKNKAEYQVCHAAVGLVGDLSRSLQAAIAPYTDDIMVALMEDLQVREETLVTHYNWSVYVIQ